MSTFSARVPVILLFLTRPSKEKKWQLKNKLLIDLGISLCFPSLVSPFQRATARGCEITRMILPPIAIHEVHVNVCKVQLERI